MRGHTKIRYLEGGLMGQPKKAMEHVVEKIQVELMILRLVTLEINVAALKLSTLNQHISFSRPSSSSNFHCTFHGVSRLSYPNIGSGSDSRMLISEFMPVTAVDLAASFLTKLVSFSRTICWFGVSFTSSGFPSKAQLDLQIELFFLPN